MNVARILSQETRVRVAAAALAGPPSPCTFAERMRQETRLYGDVIKRFGIKAT